MTKTPGQVLLEALEQCDGYENAAAAVIAHVRPQIEAEAQLVIEQKNARIASCEAALEEANARVAEARAAMVEQVIARVGDAGTNPLVHWQAELRALAALPPTHVCVPLEPTEAMIEASMQAPTALELHKGVTTDAWELLKESSILRYKAMLAASKGEA